MRITSKAISKAIEEATGIPYIGVWNGGGYHYFYSDDELVGEFLSWLTSESVYVFRMSSLTIEQWVETFQSKIKENDAESRVRLLIKTIKEGGSNES